MAEQELGQSEEPDELLHGEKMFTAQPAKWAHAATACAEAALGICRPVLEALPATPGTTPWAPATPTA